MAPGGMSEALTSGAAAASMAEEEEVERREEQVERRVDEARLDGTSAHERPVQERAATQRKG